MLIRFHITLFVTINGWDFGLNPQLSKCILNPLCITNVIEFGKKKKRKRKRKGEH